MNLVISIPDIISTTSLNTPRTPMRNDSNVNFENYLELACFHPVTGESLISFFDDKPQTGKKFDRNVKPQDGLIVYF
jgi:hypothetical protein